MTGAVPCLGIQHMHLLLHGQDDSIRSLCLEKWAYIGSRWHSNDCQFVVDRGSKKQRCVKCTNAYSNIRKSRYPKLFPSSTPISPTPIADISPESNQPTVSIGDLILPTNLLFDDEKARSMECD
eukprot:CAMPEP_0201995636 /NCGR_PEP_ID=MMETSP0905-20130828/2980_1 /ASSEMBLY_ACC=CAM_ASM_000554 /TAXON_ID=420261 /ORGANISM="Thalassiosira antarctica, Strain CCMP982" /LENGTH=123 /DNA_ID=CAMNT_0048550741 /DNA_START=307 /DNA_END=675 /DNA_ORIENTATION=-